MKFKAAPIFFAALLTLPVLGVGLARAEADETMTANVPFDFYAGNHNAQAGKYYLSVDAENHMVTIRDAAGRSGSFLMGMIIDASQPDRPVLVFDHLGDRYFLRKVDTADLDVSFPVQKAEMMLARNGAPTEVVVALNR